MAGHPVHYTYLLESLARPGIRYVGHTSDLKQRLADHNAGRCPHTSKNLPWKVKVYVAFEELRAPTIIDGEVIGVIDGGG